jgi:signal transduction histidine kinase
MPSPLALLRAPRLAARASHEVRGPLTVASLLLDDMIGRGDVAPQAARALDLQLQRARLAVDDLAAAASGSRAPDRLEVVTVCALLERIAAAWRVDGVRVAVPADDRLLLIDPMRIEQAVGNLLSNALEHGAAPVEVRARVSGGRLRLEVRDSGPGLAAPLTALARRREGERGHGLAIAAGIAERHGGRLLAAPSASGATVAIELRVRA